MEMEVLQTATLAVISFVWTEIRSLRKDVNDARERLKALEALVDQ